MQQNSALDIAASGGEQQPVAAPTPERSGGSPMAEGFTPEQMEQFKQGFSGRFRIVCFRRVFV